VNGAVASVGDRIDPDHDSVRIDGTPLPVIADLVTWLVYKPVGVVSTMDDPQGRPTVRELVPPEPLTKPVGRLDLHSEGLMIMTNDGDLALIVTHPRYGVPKTYQILVERRLRPPDIAPLSDGIELDDGNAAALSARIVSASGGRTMVELVMTEGRKREIRRMFDQLDIPVARLVRTAIGPIVDRRLDPGSHRPLTPDEIRSLYAFARDRSLDG
jgi:23S rRNA pseudouridine2605 synthase